MRDNKPDGRLSEIERSKYLTDLKECLRTYDVLGLWRDAEDVLRREVIRPFLRKVRTETSTIATLSYMRG
jgi:hypothetical protein